MARRKRDRRLDFAKSVNTGGGLRADALDKLFGVTEDPRHSSDESLPRPGICKICGRPMDDPIHVEPEVKPDGWQERDDTGYHCIHGDGPEPCPYGCGGDVCDFHDELDCIECTDPEKGEI